MLSIRARVEKMEARVRPRNVVRFCPPELLGEQTREPGITVNGRITMIVPVVVDEKREGESSG